MSIKETFIKHHRKALIILSVIFLLFIGLDYFITQKSAYILGRIVKEVTKGKYILETSSVKFTYFPESIRATNIHMRPAPDSLPRQVYQLDADTIFVGLRSIWPLLFKRSLDIEEISLVNPTLVLQAKNDELKKLSGEFNLRDNLLLIQEQLNNTISVLRMNRFRIDNLNLRIHINPQKYFQADRIFLHIDDLVADVANNKSTGNLELEGDIHLWLDKPTIIYPDSNLNISLDHFDWSSKKRNLNIQNIGFSWRQQKEKSDSFHIDLHAVSFSKLEWSDWVNSGKMHFDSVAASTGRFYMQKLNTRDIQDTSKTRKGILSLFSPLSINHFEIRQIQSGLMIETNGTPATGSLKGDSLKIEELKVDISNKQPISFSTIDLAIREFSSQDRDEKWRGTFSSFRINRNHVLLRDYLLQSKDYGSPENKDMLRVPALEMNGVSIPDLLAGKLIVKELGLASPFIQISAEKKNERNNRPYHPFRESIPFLNVQSLRIRNGTYVNRDRKTGTIRFQADGINGHVYANKFLAARAIADFPATLDEMKIANLHINLAKWKANLQGVELIPSRKWLHAEKAMLLLTSQAGNAEFRGITLEFDSLNSLSGSKKSLNLRKIAIDSGNLELDLSKTRHGASRNKNPDHFHLTVDSISLGNTNIDLRTPDLRIRSYLKNFLLNDVSEQDENLSWGKASGWFSTSSISGKDWSAEAKSVEVNNESTGSVNGLQFSLRKPQQQVEAKLGAVQFIWPLHKPGFSDIHIPYIGLIEPDIALNFSQQETSSRVTTPVADMTKRLAIEVDSISIERPRVHADSRKQESVVELQTRIHRIHLSHAVLSREAGEKMTLNAKQFYIDAGTSSFRKDTGFQVAFGGLSASLADLKKTPGPEPFHFSVMKFQVDSVQLDARKADKRKKIEADQITLKENTMIYIQQDSLLRNLYNMPSLTTKGANLHFEDASKTIQVKNINADLPGRKLEVDSFSFANKINRDSFFRAQPFEQDYFTISSGRIEAKDLQIVKHERDTGFSVSKLSIDNLFVKAERDKRRPDDTIVYKPLLVKMIQKIPLPINFDTLALERSTIWHNVIAEKSGEEGSIFFTDVNGWIGNIKNFDLRPDDTLKIRVYSKLMGSGDLYMRFRESYLDSLQDFLLTARMGKFAMPELDRILVPLTRIRIAKGQIDTLWLQVRANDLLAFGEMEIDYHKLKVEKLDNQEKKQGFVSWLANIIVRTTNKKVGTIYVERLQNKSTFNYWGKIALSGLLTNIRVASNKKNIKKYEAALKKYQLPAHLLDEDY